MQEQLSIITDDIRISPNEYVVKYAVNRNFIKLLHNDEVLSTSNTTIIDHTKVQTYVPGRVYLTGDMVFYKTTQDSQSLYLLESQHSGNTHQPNIQISEATGMMMVVNSEHWKIVGIPTGADRNPKDVADEYILSSTIDFIESHEANRQLSAHPTGELGLSKSDYAFTSLDNLASDRKSFFYPNRLVSMNPDSAIQCGYMRQWDNGLLEYDIVFKLGSEDRVVDGQEIISANTLAVTHRNQNNFYFKENADYNVFNQGDEYYVSVNKTKQVNLNQHVNAYSTELKFPEAFRDLNYMVFTSNMKNVETEAFNIKNEILTSDVDSRLIVNGLELTGHKDDAQWETPCKIPMKIVNIGQNALANTYSAGDYPIVVTIDPDSDLLNIEKYAFSYSDIGSITIPKNVKHIGEGAFSSCSKLKTVDIWLDIDPAKQPKLDALVFSNSPQLEEINLRYYTPMMLAASNTDDEHRQKQYSTAIDLYDKLTDSDLKVLYQLKSDVKVNQYYVNPLMNGTSLKSGSFMTAAQPHSPANGEQHEQVTHIDLALLTAKPKAKKMLLAAPHATAAEYLIITGDTITGYDADKMLPAQDIDLNELDSNVTKIASNAFENCVRMVGITISDNFVSIGDDAFAGCSGLVRVSIKRNGGLVISPTAFASCCLQSLEVDASGQSIADFITLSSVNTVSLSALNFGANTLSVIDADSYASDFTLVGPSTIQTNAFTEAKQIGKVIITPASSGLTCNAHIFNPNQLTSSTGTIIEHQVQGLQILGNKFKLLSCSFENIYAETLGLDMTGSKVYKEAFKNSLINTLQVSSIYAGEIIHAGAGASSYELSGFGIQSLAMAELEILNFTDVDDMSTVSSMLINQNITDEDVHLSANVLSCPEGCVVKSRDQDVSYVVFNKQLVNVPSYLSVVDKVVVSCDFDMIEDHYEEGLDSIKIPYGVVGIDSNVFNVTSMSEKRKGLLTTVFIPNSMKSIGDNCFRGNHALTSIMFEPGTELTSAGTQLVSGCNSLPEIIVKK